LKSFQEPAYFEEVDGDYSLGMIEMVDYESWATMTRDLIFTPESIAVKLASEELTLRALKVNLAN